MSRNTRTTASCTPRNHHRHHHLLRFVRPRKRILIPPPRDSFARAMKLKIRHRQRKHGVAESTVVSNAPAKHQTPKIPTPSPNPIAIRVRQATHPHGSNMDERHSLPPSRSIPRGFSRPIQTPTATTADSKPGRSHPSPTNPPAGKLHALTSDRYLPGISPPSDPHRVLLDAERRAACLHLIAVGGKEPPVGREMAV